MRPRFEVTIYPRDLTNTRPITPPGVTFAVEWYAWNVLGGPDNGVLTASGEAVNLAELIEDLRCPIEIRDEIGRLVWWGYIAQVTVNVNGTEFGAGLDSMSNRVAVAYSGVDPGSATVGERRTTAWVDNDESIAEYGAKELLAALDGATDEQAEQVRDLLLAQAKYPIATWLRAAGQANQARLDVQGWWHATNWILYSVATTASVATTTQIANGLLNAGQFFTAVEIETASGISTSEYRNGESSLRAELDDLLKSGTSGGARLQARVEPDRSVRVLAEPAAGAADYTVDARGRLTDGNGLPIEARTCPAGMWLKLIDGLPDTVDVSKLINAQIGFVERAEYRPQDDGYFPELRGVPTPWEIGNWLR